MPEPLDAEDKRLLLHMAHVFDAVLYATIMPGAESRTRIQLYKVCIKLDVPFESIRRQDK